MKLILIFFIQMLFCNSMFLASAAAGDSTVLVVNDTDDSVQPVTWHQNMNLLEVTALHERSPYTKVIYVISDDHLKEIKRLTDSSLSATIIPSGCLIIFGKLSAKRENKLRGNPKIDQAFSVLPRIQYFDQ